VEEASFARIEPGGNEITIEGVGLGGPEEAAAGRVPPSATLTRGTSCLSNGLKGGIAAEYGGGHDDSDLDVPPPNKMQLDDHGKSLTRQNIVKKSRFYELSAMEQMTVSWDEESQLLEACIISYRFTLNHVSPMSASSS